MPYSLAAGDPTVRTIETSGLRDVLSGTPTELDLDRLLEVVTGLRPTLALRRRPGPAARGDVEGEASEEWLPR